MTTFARFHQSVGQLTHFLQPPAPPSKKFTQSANPSSCPLTSAESRRLLQEKGKKKEAQKEQRRKDAEESEFAVR